MSKIIIGNQKMYMTKEEVSTFAKALKEVDKNNINVIVCPTYPFLEYYQDIVPVGAQNVSINDNGAYTGEVSASQLKSLNVPYCIVGHSERRAMFNETDETCNLKVKKAFEVGLLPILCCGESLEQRETGKTEEVLKNQIVKDLEGLTKEQVEELVIAYEPIWAIGTGKTATSEVADETCGYIRSVVAELYGQDTADKVRIQYGGSVKTSNIDELMSMPNIDGALIGGASLKAEDFIKLVNAAVK